MFPEPILRSRREVMKKGPLRFFLGSSEHRGDWGRARVCELKRRLRTADGRDCALVEVAPPVIGQPFGLGDQDIDSLILVPRAKDATFASTIDRTLPVPVYR